MTIEAMRAHVSDLLGEPVRDDDDLLDAGMDSIRIMTLVERLRAEGVEVSFEDLAERPTVAAWAAIVGAAA